MNQLFLKSGQLGKPARNVLCKRIVMDNLMIFITEYLTVKNIALLWLCIRYAMRNFSKTLVQKFIGSKILCVDQANIKSFKKKKFRQVLKTPNINVYNYTKYLQ